MKKTKLGSSPDRDFYTGKVGTQSGRLIDLYDPDPDDFDIRDIALGLSNIHRFNGQTRPGYSVAQHSVLVAMMFNGMNDARLQLAALLHDAHEAYTGDIVRPVKGMKELKQPISEIEDRVTAAIFDRFGILEYLKKKHPKNHLYPRPIQIVDDLILVQEAIHLMRVAHNEWPQVRNESKLRTEAAKLGMDDYPPPISDLLPIGQEDAERSFLSSFSKVQQRINKEVNP